MRFDMDALPVEEQTSVPYASMNAGVMHACGHDGHMAIGLAIARLLRDRQSEFAGLLKLVFQPGEEGLHGARRMVDEGVLEAPKPDFCLGMHLWNEKEVGWLGITPGPAMAGAEFLEIKIRGRGGHGAAPHRARDPVIAAAELVSVLQSVISRDVNPLDTAVLSITRIEAGDTFNVIPAEAMLQGTVRTFRPEVRERILSRIGAIGEGIGAALDCEVSVRVDRVSPPVVNDPAICERIQKIARDLFPEEIIATDHRTMGSEDMAYFMEKIPGCYIFVGSGNPEKGLDSPHHNPEFNFDEAALSKGVALLTCAALALLEAA
jgi:amidohydrolase